MDTLIFYTSTNSPGKHDATGAFIPEAKKFAKHHKLPKTALIPIPGNIAPYKRRKLVLDEIAGNPGIERAILFCHGFPKKIQFGFNTDNIDTLTRALVASNGRALNRQLDVVIYACSCARRPGLGKRKRVYFPAHEVTNGSFAHMLALSLSAHTSLDINVWAHFTAGHTSRNPYVIWFGRRDTVAWYIKPFSIHWGPWIRDMRGPLRFNFFEHDPLEFEMRYEKEGGYI